MADSNNEHVPEMTPEQKKLIAKVLKELPGAKAFEPRAKGTYYGPVIASNKEFAAQQVGDASVILHPLKGMSLEAKGLGVDGVPTFKKGEVVTVLMNNGQATAMRADPAVWQERAARTPANVEQTAVAREALGENFGVFKPGTEKGLSHRYEGVIAAVTDKELIHRINSKTAIVHEVGAEVAKQYAAGQEVHVTYDKGKLQGVEVIERPRVQQRSVEPVQSEEVAPRMPTNQERAGSWAQAKDLVKQGYGEGAKIFSAYKLDAQAGKFRGPIVAVTDHHAIQRVGEGNKFVAHAREYLRGSEPQAGRFMQVNYDKGIARVTHARQPEKDRGQQQQRPAPERPTPARSQGMSR